MVKDIFNFYVEEILTCKKMEENSITEFKRNLMNKHKVFFDVEDSKKRKLVKKFKYFLKVSSELVTKLYNQYFFETNVILDENNSTENSSNTVSEDEINIITFDNLKKAVISHFLKRNTASYLSFVDIQRLKNEFELYK